MENLIITIESLAFTEYQNTALVDVEKYVGYSLYHSSPIKLQQLAIQKNVRQGYKFAFNR